MSQLRSLWRDVWIAAHPRHIPLELETLCFLAASTFDYCLTYYLLMHSEAQVVEANPAARYFLDHWGLTGLLWFKMFLVALIVVICQIVDHARPLLGGRVLNLGSAIVTCVVSYSLVLTWHY